MFGSLTLLYAVVILLWKNTSHVRQFLQNWVGCDYVMGVTGVIWLLWDRCGCYRVSAPALFRKNRLAWLLQNRFMWLWPWHYFHWTMNAEYAYEVYKAWCPKSGIEPMEALQIIRVNACTTAALGNWEQNNKCISNFHCCWDNKCVPFCGTVCQWGYKSWY